ncbi:MAG: hypothetical protein IJA94_02450 [Bacilli bacterium]|nr:hypothetical protein [Bacilli bacterium]
MKKIIGFLKRYKLMLLVALGIIIIGLIGMFIYLSKTDNRIYIGYRNDSYTFKYDERWNLVEETDDKLVLNTKDSVFSIYFKYLDDEYKYLDLEDFVEELLYDIENQNKAYKLLARDDEVSTKQNYEGYKFLFENNDLQVMIAIIKSSDLLTFFVYESSNEYFDILLDSAQKIIYSFEYFDEKLELTYELNLETSDVEWDTNNEIATNLKKQISDEIASNNYLVNYTIPGNFIRSDFNSTAGYFNYESLEKGSITLSATIRNINLYKFLDKDDISSIFSNYNYIRENNEAYINLKENIEKIDNDKVITYLYKNSYTNKGGFGDYYYENVELIYELDSSHIFYVKIAATNVNIPKELIEKIEINDFKNYSSYINRKVVDGYINGEIKEYTDYSKEKIRKIQIKLPEKYNEIDKGNNIFSERSYGLNYDAKKNMYEYELDYKMQLDLETALETLQIGIKPYSNRKNYKSLAYVNDKVIGNKTFKIYEAGYTDYSGSVLSLKNKEEVYKKITILVYQFGEKCFTIKIVGNGYEISDELLKEVTTFNIVEE